MVYVVKPDKSSLVLCAAVRSVVYVVKPDKSSLVLCAAVLSVVYVVSETSTINEPMGAD